MQKILIIFGVLIGSGLAASLWTNPQIFHKETVPKAVEASSLYEKENTETIKKEEVAIINETAIPEEEITETEIIEEKKPIITEPIIAEEINLNMQFYSQAPFGNWDFPWQEACEEASVLLVANEYFGHQWSKEDFRDKILQLVEWENNNFGTYLDTNMSQTSRILEDYLGLKTKIHTDPSFEDMQTILNKGHFIIMPFAGQELGNPFYSGAGPVYHVLVAKGYTKDGKIITHDVGTKRGADFIYDWKVLDNALHDYMIPIDNGLKKIIEVIPNA